MQQYIMSKSSYCDNWLSCLKPSSVFPFHFHSILFPTGPCVIWVAHTSQLPLKSLCPFHDTHWPRWPPSVPWTCPNCLSPQKSYTDTYTDTPSTGKAFSPALNMAGFFPSRNFSLIILISLRVFQTILTGTLFLGILFSSFRAFSTISKYLICSLGFTSLPPIPACTPAPRIQDQVKNGHSDI